MSTFILEKLDDGLNFENLLYGFMNEEPTSSDKNTKENNKNTKEPENPKKTVNTKKQLNTKCLITDENLLDDHVKLECGHRFNYLPIFNEVCKQKHNQNYLEVLKLKKNQLKCPYCRNVQNFIIPYREGYEKTMYVNWPKSFMETFLCSKIISRGPRKGEKCGRATKNEDGFCKYHKPEPTAEAKATTKAKTNEKVSDEKVSECCQKIIKRGKNKGNICSKKIKSNGLCGFHLYLSLKSKNTKLEK